MTAVPRLYESLHARITQGLKKESDLKRKLFSRAVALGIKRIETGSLSMMERIEDATLDSLVRSKVRERFGGRLKALVSGGAPLNYDIGMFFSSLGLCLLQGYGQTEAGPVVTCNRPASINLNTVGPALIDVELKIAEDGEILVRGPLLMEGYWKRADDTAEALKDGWLHTGDVGGFDAEGRLMITDRKKDLIVNAGGDNIAPQRVEGILALEEEIEQAMVFGDKRPNLVALIVPGEDFCRSWAVDHGVDQASLLQDAAFRSDVQAAVDRANEKMSRIERVRRWAFADEAFTTDNGLMTATMKIRRKFITAHYLDRLEALY
jgi:long-chain acyl-CoA synthetase